MSEPQWLSIELDGARYTFDAANVRVCTDNAGSHIRIDYDSVGVGRYAHPADLTVETEKYTARRQRVEAALRTGTGYPVSTPGLRNAQTVAIERTSA